jgi:two-component system sensor histidine kinase CpxA
VKFEANENCKIDGNEQLLRRAVENVIRNAVQYTAPGTEVEVKLECDAETVAGSVEPRVATISVRDHGAGVPQEALGKIFRPFYRVDDARDREAGGVGLGLAIADRAVRLHGGTVSASNAAAGGLIVSITLPNVRERKMAAD